MQTDLTPMKIYRARAGAIRVVTRFLITGGSVAALALGGAALVHTGISPGVNPTASHELRQELPARADLAERDQVTTTADTGDSAFADQQSSDSEHE
jgi:hypothetical protein